MPANKVRGTRKAIEIGARIADIRKYRGYSQTELADRLNITQVQVSRYERGVDLPDVILIEILSDLFGVNPGTICGWS
jgi:transcriptional regulator with XRE-family HTH domain